MPAAVLDDLEAEHDALDAILAGLDVAAWDVPTPAERWAVRDQVFHLAFGEELAATAVTDRSAFEARLAELLGRLDALERECLAAARQATPGTLLDRWRTARTATLTALRALAPGARVPWITGEMSAPSFATARLMETWAHGQDVVDALGVTRLPTARLRHIAHLGVRTREFSYAARGMAPPAGDVHVRLEGPEGDLWVWGPEDAPDRVAGPAADFCLVVTRRRHPADTRLVIEGEHAAEWMSIAQAYAGPPSTGRPAGTFAERTR